MNSLKERLFNTLDFNNLEKKSDFKEDSVREEIILPLIKYLGYSQESIIRSKNLQHPFLKIGSKKRPITQIPDYLLKVADRYAWVLDAKSPKEKINVGEHIEQVFSYAMHPEIRTTYFALCNGIEFALFRTDSTDKPILFFNLIEIDKYWESLQSYLSPNSFQIGKKIRYENIISKTNEVFDYANRQLLGEIIVKKQMAKRHFGVHGYFTKQAWNVVAEYIKNFSKEGDLVLDPFGGSGVTAIESLMNKRKAISIDLNPMIVFIVNSLITPVNIRNLVESFDEIINEFIKLQPKNEKEIAKALTKYPYPKGFVLPKSSDVKVIEDLFSKKQLAELALLKYLIKKQKNINIRNSLMLMFSGLLNKINLTYHSSEGRSEGRGNSSVFAYYRYRLAPNPATIDIIQYFTSRLNKVIEAKKEMTYQINEQTINNAKIIKGTATNLDGIANESVDYIYTDPPYGKKIPYLDLSVMWNAWLDLEVTKEDYQLEAIEGGEKHKSKNEYNELIAQSIKEMYRVLKFDRWLSFVFAHKDPEFWHLIINTAENCGFEYVGAVPQKNGQTSFKKRQNPFTVLSGQLIINFRKVKNPRALMKANLGMDITDTIMQTIEGVIAKNHGATLEQINDELIIKGLELGFLDLLKKQYSDLTPILMQKFDYDNKSEIFTIKKNTKFTSHIDLKLRVLYYLTSYLRRKERENKVAHFDEIILEILPLLKNGVTPEHQTILTVLEDIAERAGADGWQLKQEGNRGLF